MKLHPTRTVPLSLAVTLTVAGVALGGIASAAVRGSAIFPDVAEDSYYDEAIGELYGEGVIKGYESGAFGPDDYVTRGQVAVMMQRLRDDLTGTVRSSSRSSTARSSRNASSDASSQASFARGAFRFTTSSFTIPETRPSFTASVIRSGSDSGEVTVDYAVEAISATAGEDFTVRSGTLTFKDGVTSSTITVTLKDDEKGEGNETIRLVLRNPSDGAGIGSPGTAELTIIDNEEYDGSSSSAASGGSSASSTSAAPGAGTLSLGAAGYLVNENAGTMTVTVVRTGGSQGTVGVSFATEDGSAKKGSDYGQTAGTLSFGGGETSKSFTIPIQDDGILDGSATFSVKLSSPTGGAALGTATADVSINDNENEAVSFGSGSLKFSKSSYSVTEGEGTARITVQRVGGSVGTIAAQYATTSGSAGAGLDYTSVSGTLTFAPGESSKTFDIPILKDSMADTGETVYLNLSANGSTQLTSPTSATLTIY